MINFSQIVIIYLILMAAHRNHCVFKEKIKKGAVLSLKISKIFNVTSNIRKNLISSLTLIFADFLTLPFFFLNKKFSFAHGEQGYKLGLKISTSINFFRVCLHFQFLSSIFLYQIYEIYKILALNFVKFVF